MCAACFVCDQALEDSDDLLLTRAEPSSSPPGQTCFDWYRGPGRRSDSELSERETEVVRLLAQGLAAKQAASRLGIACKTVNNHRQNAMRKLGLRSRAEVVLYAVRSGMVRP